MNQKWLMVWLLMVIVVLAGRAASGQTPTCRLTPKISSITPASATAGSPAFTLHVRGSAFCPYSIVNWNGQTLATTYSSAGALLAQVTQDNLAVAGTFPVTVDNLVDNDPTSSAVNFTVTIGTPTISTLSHNRVPAGAPGLILTVNGSNFVPASSVQFGGSSRTTTFVSSSQLKAQLLAADLAVPGPTAMTVVNPAPGGASSPVTFTVFVFDKITFQSGRAPNGTDAANTTAPNVYSTSNIWAMSPDGSRSLTGLTASGAHSFDPVWSPDGTKIAYSSARTLNHDIVDAANDNDALNIWVMSADGSNPTALTQLKAAGANSFTPVWSPDGSKIAFASSRALDGSDAANPALNIWVMGADGSNPTALTRLTAVGANSFDPVWSPDGSRIAFVSARILDAYTDAANVNGTENIWIMDSDGSSPIRVTLLTALGADSFNPVWSPDGIEIAFSSAMDLYGRNAANAATNIWTGYVPGNNLCCTNLTSSTASGTDSFNPVWSPDGTLIFFDSSRSLNANDLVNTNTRNIWVVAADGGGDRAVTQITAVDAGSSKPVFSRDGSKIVFESTRALDPGSDAANTNRTRNIWMINADGSGVMPLTNATAAGADSFGPRLP